MVAGGEQRLGVLPQGLGAAARGIGPGEPRGGVGVVAGAAVQLPRGHRGIHALLECQRLLVGAERLTLAEHHLRGIAEQHPRVRVLGEPLGGFLGGGERAPAILQRPGQMHQRDVGLAEAGRPRAGEPQPPRRPLRGVALAGGGAAHGEARQRGAEALPHCLIMGRAPGRLQPT